MLLALYFLLVGLMYGFWKPILNICMSAKFCLTPVWILAAADSTAIDARPAPLLEANRASKSLFDLMGLLLNVFCGFSLS